MATFFVNITDENGVGKIVRSQQVSFDHELVTVSEIIEKRVREEVAQHNKQRSENFSGLVQPVEMEQRLNGSRLPSFIPINVEKQVAVARQAFTSNGFFLLIDNLQAERLEQTFLLHARSTINFLKLTPLVGG